MPSSDGQSQPGGTQSSAGASHVVAGRGGAGSRVLGRVGFVVARRAVTAQQSPAEQQQAGGRPADVEGGAHLALLPVRHERIVEVPDDVVGRPRHGHHHQQAGQQEHHACHDHGLGLGRLILHAVGALAPDHGQQHAQGGHDNADDGERAGRLQVLRQRQQRVVHLALHLPRALHHTVHPQPFPARALIVVAILLAAFGLFVALVGAQCTNCVQDETAKAKITIVAGVLFLLAALLTLVPVSWSANTIIQDFYNPLVPEAQKREMGAGLYVGWAASALQLLGGALLCCSCPPRDKYATTKIAYSAPRSAGPGTTAGTAYDRKDYV
uniref:Claudin-3 n=1 Tax=Oryctolagus cuniculus TaxID=9986 RepID=A0A5F9DGM5_RABIT